MAHAPIQTPYALHEGRLLYAEKAGQLPRADVPKDTSCPECGAPVTLRRSKHRTSWVHLSGQTCRPQDEHGHRLSGGEGDAHRAAKLTLQAKLQGLADDGETLRLGFPCGFPERRQLDLALATRDEEWGLLRPQCDEITERRFRGWDRVAAEYAIKSKDGQVVARADLALLKGDRLLLAIEVCSSHPVPEDKRLALAWLGVPWVEVDVDRLSTPAWWESWAPPEPLRVDRADVRLEPRCPDHRWVSGVEHARIVEVTGPPLTEGGPGLFTRVPVLCAGHYHPDGALHCRSVVVDMRPAVVLGMRRAEPDNQSGVAGVNEILERGLGALRRLNPAWTITPVTPWMSLAEHEPGGRREVARRWARDLTRFPPTRVWDADEGAWGPAEAGVAPARPGPTPESVDAWLAAMAAFGGSQEDSAFQRRASGGQPPVWGAAHAEKAKAWEATQAMGDAFAALRARDPGLTAMLQRHGVQVDVAEAITRLERPDGTPVIPDADPAMHARLKSLIDRVVQRVEAERGSLEE